MPPTWLLPACRDLNVLKVGISGSEVGLRIDLGGGRDGTAKDYSIVSISIIKSTDSALVASVVLRWWTYGSAITIA